MCRSIALAGYDLTQLGPNRLGPKVLLCFSFAAWFHSLTHTGTLYISCLSKQYSTAELIINSVVLLFVNEVDSQVFSIAYIFNSKWLHEVIDEAEEYSDALLQQDVVDDSVVEAARNVKSEAGPERSDVVNNSRASSQDPSKASGVKRKSGASSLRGRSTKSSLGGSQQRELLMKFESLQRQMSELQAEITGPCMGPDDIIEEIDQNEAEVETPQQQSSCAVQ
jgi:hypothetical protein